MGFLIAVTRKRPKSELMFDRRVNAPVAAPAE
jgi:hypothetical protein